MTPPIVQGLRSDIVPHREWALSKWFYANPLWYYHRQGTDEEIVANRKFYQLVDTELREVCKIVHDAGLQTTPSCQGHFYPRERFERIWDQLKHEDALIRGEGLDVRDSETDTQFLFKDPRYALPWRDFGAFYGQAASHQGTGYLGILIPFERGDLHQLFRSIACRGEKTALFFDDHIGRILGGYLFNVLVQATNPVERSQQWITITIMIKRLLSGPAMNQPAARELLGRICG